MTSASLRAVLITSTMMALASLAGVVGAWGATEDRSIVLLALCASALGVAGSVALHAAFIRFSHRALSLPRALVTRRLHGTLVITLALSCLLPLGWLAHAHERVLDLSSFTQVSPGESTRRVTSQLAGVLRVTAFLPPTSDLAPVFEAYFAPLDAVDFSRIDQRSHPEASRRLGVRDNGTLVLEYVSSTGATPAIKRLEVGLSRHQARQTISKLDRIILTQLQSLSSSRRTVYVLQGHDELSLAGKGAGGPASFAQGRTLLEERLNLKVEPLGLLEGGLNEVPEDAGAVLVLGPLRTPSAQQIEVLMRYLDRGGALLLAHEPGSSAEAFAPLHDLMLIRMQDVPLATLTQSLTLTRTRLDRYNLVTRDVVNHPATSSFRDPRDPLSLIFPSTGYLEELAAPGDLRQTFIEPLVGSPSSSWDDRDGDYDYDPASESRARRILSLAARPRDQADPHSWRAIVMADSTVFSDLVLTRSQGNEALLLDHVSWLLDDASSPGTPGDQGDRTLALLTGPDRTFTLGLLALAPLLCLMMTWSVSGARRRRTP